MSRFLNITALLKEYLKSEFGDEPFFIDGEAITVVRVQHDEAHGYCVGVHQHAFPCKDKESAIKAAKMAVEASEIVKGLRVAGAAAISERSVDRMSKIMKGQE
jgi:hypothetical protein